MDRLRAFEYIGNHEGKSTVAYRDSENILTIGIGFNLEDPTAPARCSAIGLDHAGLCNRLVSLDPGQMEQLFKADFDTALEDAAAVIPNFWDLPEDAQFALVDMSYQLGKPRLSKFQKMIEALTANPPNFLVAAEEIKDSLYYRQTPNRAEDNIMLVRGCAV
jgi:GH24 family phage-related lysozyme (muramidase)